MLTRTKFQTFFGLFPNNSTIYLDRKYYVKLYLEITELGGENFMSLLETAKRLTEYKAWANEITFSAVKALPEGEATKERKTRFKNMIHTLNHVYIIDCIFKAHLEKKPHSYTARNTETYPPLEELCSR